MKVFGAQAQGKQSETEAVSTLMVVMRMKVDDFMKWNSDDRRVWLEMVRRLWLRKWRDVRLHNPWASWGVCNAVFIRTSTKRMAIHPCTMPRLLNGSLICRGKLFTWSSLHPLSLFTPQSRSLSAVIFGSFRTASLSFTLGSISMSLERISKARGRYIIQAWSSCPGLILTQSQVGHMLQLNSPSPYLNVVSTNLSLLVDLREIHKTDTVLYKSVSQCIYLINLPDAASRLTKR